MANILHSVLQGSEIHEPKGADTASEKQVYLSDGTGSGAWTNWPTGWGYYVDNTAQVFGNSYSKLTISGTGSGSDSTHLPIGIRGSGELWDSSTNVITPMAVGDAYDMRLNLPVTAETGSPTEITIQLDIGGGASPSIVVASRYAGAGRATPYTITLGFPIFTLNTFITNGGQFFVKTDSGSVTITNPGLLLVRNHPGDI